MIAFATLMLLLNNKDKK
ncbi:hypothetical protein [Lactococcus allomyrinae]|nr:hypothetical protein [Lactococcus allomyrinae]